MTKGHTIERETRKSHEVMLLSCIPSYLLMIIFALFLVTGMTGGYASAKSRPVAGQKTYASPDDAVEALSSAVRSNDDRALVEILGKGSQALISSGDRIDDLAGREKFLKAYDGKNRIEVTGDKAMLYVGDRDYPFPIPLIKKRSVWSFDTMAGKEELLCRRVGRNELNVIDVLNIYTDAQREYASRDRDGDGVLEFAQSLISNKGKKDGLYWKTEEGEEESPFGPLVARASREGYREQPFHGYYFRILRAQGKNARGGAFDYVSKGNMILGFGLVAYPAKYGSSGVMTFIVNQEGVIYQKDLGRSSSKAEKMTRFNPDKSWKKVEEAGKQQD